MNDLDLRDNYINGEWIHGDEGHSVNFNPADTRRVNAHYARGSADQVHLAVSAAREAFRGWSQTTPSTRSDLLWRLAAAVDGEAPQLSRLVTAEEGKTLGEAKAEVARAAQILRFFAGEAMSLHGSAGASTRDNVSVEVRREPVGVVGAIAPWNFPIAIPVWKIAPAIAFGNTVVLKPAELAPGPTWALVRLAHECGIPRGVLNLVMGRGSEVGRSLAEHRDVDALTFTGSSQVGLSIMRVATSSLKKVQLEMGGKNPLVVADDADLDLAVDLALDGAYRSTGQRCTASSRLIVLRTVYQPFVDALRQRVAEIRVGDPFDASTDIGPVADTAQLDENQAQVAAAKKEGLEVFGGDLLQGSTPGHFMRPALVLDDDGVADVSTREVFGPIASAIPAEDFDHALELANATEFGLAAGVVTRSLAKAEAFRRNVDAGMIMVNLPTAGVDPHMPFGGRKASGYGPKEQGAAAIEFFTQHKSCYSNPGTA